MSRSDAAATLADVGEAAGRLGRELVLGRHTVDELVAVTGWPVATVLAGLTLLERRGLAVGVHGRFRPAGGLRRRGPGDARQRPRKSRRPVGTRWTCSGLPGASDRCYPSARSLAPRTGPSPALDGSPDHEQERLLRQAAVALLAVPVSRRGHLGALLRRSTLARVSLAIGLAIVLGVGVMSCRSARRPSVATRPAPIVPLTQGGVPTTVVDRPRPGRARHDRLRHADGPASVASALKVAARRRGRPHLGRHGHDLTISPPVLDCRHPAHRTVQAGRPRPDRAAPRPAGRPVFLTRGPASDHAPPRRHLLGPRVALDTTFLVTFQPGRSIPRRSRAPSVSTRRPPAPSARSPASRARPASSSCPLSRFGPMSSYRLIVSGVRDTDGLPLEQASVAVHTTTAPSVVRFRPVANEHQDRS